MAEADDRVTVIGADATMNGELTFQHSARILGRFEGRIAGGDELSIAQGATCRADVEAENVAVDGTHEGNLVARSMARLSATGVIRGDVTAARMVMAEGATFFGNAAVGSEATEEEPQVSEEPLEPVAEPEAPVTSVR